MRYTGRLTNCYKLSGSLRRPDEALLRYLLTQARNVPTMKLKSLTLRLSLTAALLGSLSACTVVPTYPVGYQRPPPAYVETYPVYGYPSTSIYYQSGYRYYDGYGDRHHDHRGYDDRRSYGTPLPPPLQLHRDVRRSLGLPRLPGMP